uniref:Uncharacterized protein n=1 Tax=viral metagenome TaxID=1070528 RepID=A0A6M3K0J7_9ZZZZ
MAAQLTFETTYQKQPSGTKGINDWMELNCSPATEVFRVTSDADGDFFYCNKISRTKAVMVQNHGATFATGVSRDTPKITIRNGTTTMNAKITIGHTATAECFSVIVIGEL